MNAISILTAILTLMAGIGVFLMACHLMSSHLESAGSKRLKQLFARVGESKWTGVGIGALGTAAIQSSGAVTVMVIGFVNVGIMSLTQAATVIYGANIGTTVTAQLVALGMLGGNGISTTIIFSALAGVGAFILMFAKRESWKHTGGILTGFGILFVGLGMMSNAMDDFAALDSVKQFLASIKNPLLIVFLGALLTAVIQSSSVLTSIAITMVVAGLLSLNQGIYLTMGSNIGSCVVAIMAGITSGRNAKRTALIHLFFNVMGVVFFLLIAVLLHLFTKGNWSFGKVFEVLFPHTPQVQLAMFHTVFNVCTTLVALPLTEALVCLVCRIIPEHVYDHRDDKFHLHFLDDSMLATPALAVRQLKAEIENMARLAMDNFKRSINIVTTMDFGEAEKFAKTEQELNFLNGELLRYMVLLSDKPLSKFDNQFLNASIRSVSDLERIGDYAENIVEYAESLKAQNASFSAQAVKEIRQMERYIIALYEEIQRAYHDNDNNALERALMIEEEIDNLTKKMEHNHIQRLVNGECTPQVGAEYLSLAKNAERIADHLINVGNTIRE
ncbi:MAG: Na/Pi cotransporter family protein [Bacteroidales bacterium]|nr:Na/Pi cotransporter family protein [Bacteroidales bacterium]MBR3730650.1 Na/Pi cotransporter family protein [Bacteroidales bacterium]MBR6929482.1 Na/Pi cotransporter family protein [Bacteroidales bacterium]